MTSVFVASPYSHPSPAVRAERVAAASRYEAYLLGRGFAAFVPIAITGRMHPELPGNFLFWVPVNHAALSCCAIVHALRLPGWRDSQGMADEIALAGVLGKPVVAVEPDEDGWRVVG